MSKFIHNKSTANVSLIEGKFLLPIGGKAEITDAEASHSDVIHAVRNKWVTLEGKESTSATPPAPEAISFAEDPMKGSTSIPTVAKKVEATSSPIGRADTDAEVESEEVETKPKRTPKKAAA